jgi:hypothetical protein
VFGEQRIQTDLVNGRNPVVESFHPLAVHVHSDNAVALLGQTGSGDYAHISQSDDRHVH